MSDANVTQIIPKAEQQRYRDYSVTVTFDVPTGKWTWLAVKRVVTEIIYRGHLVGSVSAGFAAAKRKIDKEEGYNQ